MFGELILRFRWASMALLVFTLAVSAYLLPGIEINQDFAKHFPDEDPDLEFYRQMTAELGDEDDLLMVAVHRENGIFDTVFLQKFHAFTLAAGRLANVTQAQSITKLDDVRRTPFGIMPSPFLHPSDPAFFTSDSMNLLNDERLPERLVSTDLKTLTVILELKKGRVGNASEALISSIENLGREYHFDEMYIMGRKYFEVTYNRISNRELKKGFVLCLGLIVLLLGYLYRSFWAVALPILAYVFSMLIFLGYLVLRGHPLDAMTNLAPTILLIVSISDVIHFFSKYEDQVKAGLNKRTALKTTLNSIGLAIFLTSFTTAIGFLSLLTSDLPSMRKFGGDIAAGVMLAFLITVILVPFALYFIPEKVVHIRSGWHRWWDGAAVKIFQFITIHPGRVVWPTVALMLVGILGLTQINTNNFFVSSLPANHPSHKAVEFFEKNLGGVRTFEVALVPKDSALLNDLALLREIEKLHRHVASRPRTSGVYSPVTFYKSLNKAWHGGRADAYALPESQQALERQERFFEKSPGAIFHRILNEKKTLGKVSARMNDIGRENVKVLNRETGAWIAAHLDTSLLQTRIIGASAMADKIQEHAIRNMFSGLGLALLVIGALIFLLYRQWSMVLVVMVVNLFPLILTGALMALLGIELRYGTSVIFTIGFVIAVDDTIHFVGRYRMERAKGVTVPDAVFVTLQETGRAMLLTSVVLFFGFALLITSGFRDAQAVGILVSFMLVFALLADIFLGPLLILKLGKNQRKIIS